MENEVLQCIRTRRSCRSYAARQVEPEVLAAITEAGTWAASGHGWQAARIVVLQDAAEIAELERMNAAALGSPDAHPFTARRRYAWCWRIRSGRPAWRTARW